MTIATEQHVRRLPKVELHCHIEGASRAGTIKELAEANGMTFPVEDPADLYHFTDLNQFLDDPGMMRFDVADEYAVAAQAFDYSLEEMEAISLDGITASWAPDDEKAALRHRFEAEFDELRAEYGLPSGNGAD